MSDRQIEKKKADGRPTQAQHYRYSAPVLTSKPGAGTPDGRPAAVRWNRV